MAQKKEKKKKKDLTEAEIVDRDNKRMDRQYFASIERIFTRSGFASLEVEEWTFDLLKRPRCELDHCFFLENIIIICEQTIGSREADHLIRKQETAAAINADVESKLEFLTHLSSRFPNKFDASRFGVARWKISYLYFSKKNLDISEADQRRYSNLTFIDRSTYNYLDNMSKCIRASFKYEIFRFLGLDFSDVGPTSPGAGTPIPLRAVSIIYPNDVTGLNDGVGIVSFMMSPNELIRTSFVLRKDNWEEKIGLYQRLITEKRLKSIRKFVVENKRTFFNNVIVGLPDSVQILEKNGNVVNFSELDRYKDCTLQFVDGFNTLAIIDGQHRIYAYYENNVNDEEEQKVSLLRNKLNMLITGIIFPQDWDDIKRRKFQSKIFLEINKNSKNVDKDLLIHIEATKDPFSSLAIARMVLEKMNKVSPFKDMFELSLVEKAQIKVSSIIQFALSSLVSPNDSAQGLYRYWIPCDNKQKPQTLSTVEFLAEYVQYCASILSSYFCAIKNTYGACWNDPNSMILKIVSINGFIIGLHHSLYLLGGTKDFEFYKNVFQDSGIDFSKENFHYSGSRYSQFASSVIDQIFFTKCEDDYIKHMSVEVGSSISYVDNDKVVAVLTQHGNFLFEEKEFTLHQLTTHMLGIPKLPNPPGMYWKSNSILLHSLYEKL